MLCSELILRLLDAIEANGDLPVKIMDGAVLADIIQVEPEPESART